MPKEDSALKKYPEHQSYENYKQKVCSDDYILTSV
jgi:hypothetical protein